MFHLKKAIRIIAAYKIDVNKKKIREKSGFYFRNMDSFILLCP